MSHQSDAVIALPPTLRTQQRQAVDWMSARERGSPPCGGILADNVGAGKTFVVAALTASAPLWPTLVLVPKSVLWQWIEVLHRFGLGSELCVVGSKTTYAMQRAATCKLVLATHGLLLSPFLAERKWGRIVVDEAHCAKNPRSRTHRALCGLKAHARWALSATPVQNCVADLLALARFVGVLTDDAQMVRELYVLRRCGGEADDQQNKAAIPLTVRTVRLPLRYKAEEAAYALAREEAKGEEEEDEFEGEEGEQEMGSAAAHTRAWEIQLRCRQAATHPALYYGSLARRLQMQGVGGGGEAGLSIEMAALAARVRRDPSAKIAFVVEDIAAARCGCVVFCDWIDEMRLVEEALVADGRVSAQDVRGFHGQLNVQERDDALGWFRRGCGGQHRCSTVLIAQIRCAAQGLNLQCAERAYIMRPQWNPAVERQAIGRLHRSGQTRPVTVLRLVAKGTVDEAMLRRQTRKLKCVTETLRDDEMERTLTEGMGDMKI